MTMRKFLLILVSAYFICTHLQAQTPGMIIKSAGAGAAVLDPDGDDYVSQKTDGVQIGFTNPPNNDFTQSEIPYVPIVTEDPIDDLEQGKACSFSELVGDEASERYVALTYWDAANSAVLFRIRIASYVSNSKAYSVLIDTDQKFGFTGDNADPNALPGNPGFEIELALMTNFGVGIYDVDGTIDPQLITQKSYQNFVQKSVAITNFCDDADYFFDFFVPMDDLLVFGVTEDTPLRFAVLTNMNPDPCIGSNSLSDVGGSESGNSIDDKLINTILDQTPTAPTGINLGIEERSVCPQIDSIYSTSTVLSGTTVEADSTVIEVTLYDLDGVTALASDTVYAIGGVWSMPVADLNPYVALVTGQTVRASADAPSKGKSDDSCDEEIVGGCQDLSTPLTAADVTILPAGKGFELDLNYPIGTKIYLYKANYELRTTSDLKNSITNPYIVSSTSETASFECDGAALCFGYDLYIFRVEEPGRCESADYFECGFSPSASVAPDITTDPITANTTAIEGNANSAEAQVLLYVNGVYIGTDTTSTAPPYSYSIPVSGLSVGDSISVNQIEARSCISPFVSMAVTRTAFYPVITTEPCNDAYDLTSISGTSVEAEGTEITVYDVTSGRTSLGTTTVQADGSWTLSGISISAGDQITAAVTDGLYLTASADADTVSFAERLNLGSYIISLAAITEGQLTASGTISGGDYPVTIHLYVDSVPLVTKEITSADSWEVIGLNNFDFPAGAIVTASLSSANYCTSVPSSTQLTVLCSDPAAVTLSASEQAYCDGTYGQIVVHNSEEGVLYEPVLSSDSSTFGYSKMGNGGDLTLITYQITDTVNISVRGTKLPVGSCEIILASGLEFSPLSLPVTPVANPVQYFCNAGTLEDLVVNLPEGASVIWYDAYTDGTELASSTPLDSGMTYYAEAICDTTSCISLNRIGITAEEGLPLPPTGDTEQMVCYESTLADIDMNAGGPGTVVWYSTEDSETPLPMDTELQDSVIYYAEVVHDSCSSETRVSTFITFGMVPDTTRWIGLGDDADWNNGDNWNPKPPTVCSNVIIPDVGNGVQYPVISSAAVCKSITFEPGGGVLGLQYLTYEKAYVQMALQRNKWYTLTAPLKSQFSGDYYFSGAPRSYMMLFDDVNPDDVTDVAIGTWTKAFANMLVPLSPGMGFGFLVDSVEFDYPNPAFVTQNDKMVYFPREETSEVLINTVTPYSGITGKMYPFLAKTLPRDSSVAYRFAMENEVGVLEDVHVDICPGLNLIGNPLMTHLDYDALYSSNTAKISNKVKFWNGTTFVTYMAGSDISSDMDLAYTKVPPMQSFFVEGLSFISEGTQLDINIENHFVADTVTKLRSSKALPDQVLQIKSSINNLESSTVIAKRNGATNGYDNMDAFKLFTQYKQVPEVYTIADFRSLDINQFSSLPYMVPLGIKSSSVGFISLEFLGAKSFEGMDVTLINTLTGEQQNLKTNNMYELYNDETMMDGNLFIEFREANTATKIDENNSCSGKCVFVYSENGTVYVTSPPEDKIQRFTLWEEQGNQICSVKNMDTNLYQVKVSAQSQVCVARVQTEARTYVVKVLVE